MEKCVISFLISLFINLLILIGTILSKYFGLDKWISLYIIGGILYFISFFAYIRSIDEYEELYIWINIGKYENLEKDDEKIIQYLTEFSLYIITTHSFTLILIIYIIILWKYYVNHLLILILSYIIGHQATYPMGKNKKSDWKNILAFFTTFELIKLGIYFYNK